MSWSVELLGTLASVIVAISLMMKSIRVLRIINLVGAALFACYGLLIMSWPVLGLNAFIVVINLFFLLKWNHEHFQLLKITSRDEEIFQFFYKQSEDDILRFHPDFKWNVHDDYRIYFIVRELLPISLFIYRKNQDNEWEILVDYSIPAYRDFKNARFLFQDAVQLMDLGLQPSFIAFSRMSQHQRYLLKMGFKKELTIGDLIKYRFTLPKRTSAR